MPSLLPLENKVLFSRFQAIIAFVPANNSETNTESLPSWQRKSRIVSSLRVPITAIDKNKHSNFTDLSRAIFGTQ
jgi:hypothetical protein